MVKKNNKYDDIDPGFMIIEEDDIEAYEDKKMTKEEREMLKLEKSDD